MSILFRLIIISMFSFVYSDCVDLDQTACEASSECEWHADDPVPACEDVVHCDDITDATECGSTEGCEWHADDSVPACEDAGGDGHDHGDEDCDEITDQAECVADTHCEWHVEDDGTAACEDAEGDGHDHAHCEDLTSETECDAADSCQWHLHDGVGECEDASSADCSETDHFNNDGLELEYDGSEIYSQFQGLIEGTVEVEVNGTKDLSIHFLDNNGVEVVIDESTVACYDLYFNVTDPSVISIDMEDNHDGHDHGDDDHSDEGEHCEDFLTETDCGAHSECEWHADDPVPACEDAGGDGHDHGDDDHGDEEHCEDFTTADTCTAHDECEWHVETDGTTVCEDAEGDGHDHGDDDHDDEDHGGHLTFELSGLAVGTTTFTVSIMHQGHADFTSMPILVTVTEEVCPVLGDLNGSGVLNVADVVYTVNYILGASTLDVTCGDMNGDGEINVSDIVAMVNIILADRVYIEIDALQSKLMITENSLTLESDGFVQGVQMTLSHGSNFDIDLSDAYISEYKTDGNETTLILVSDKSHSIIDIATFTGDIKVESIHVVNQSGNVSVNQVVELSSINVNVVGPNPFNPSTQLSIAMPEAGFLSVSVYNLLGQKVATLVDNYMEANTTGHIVNFNAGNLASGVYIVQAVTAGNVATQKIMLMK